MRRSCAFTAAQGSAFDEEYLEALEQRLRLLPYETESAEEATLLLNKLIGKMIVAAKAKDIDAVERWGVGATRQWVVLRRGITRPQRAILVQFFYELCITAGIRRRHIRSFTAHIRHLCILEGDGRRFLDAVDLTLDWRPLWKLLKNDLQVDTKNTSVFLDLAKNCKEFFDPNDIPEMLGEVLPLLSPDSATVVTIILCALLPPSRPRLYLPVLFQLGEAFNSHIVWLYILDRLAEVTESQVALNSSTAEYKDIGLFTRTEWELIINRSLSFLLNAIPIDLLSRSDRQSHIVASLKHPQNHGDAIATILIYCMAVDGPVRHSADPVSPDASLSPGFVGGSRALDALHQFITSKELLFHPSSPSQVTRPLTVLTEALSRRFIWRWDEEQSTTASTPKDKRLTHEIRSNFVSLLCTPTLMAIFGKDPDATSRARSTLRNLAHLEPDIVMPQFLERAYTGLETVNETHRTTAVLASLAEVAVPLVSEDAWFGGQKHIVPLLDLCLPGIDLNDPTKTVATTRFISCLLMTVPIRSLVGKPDRDVPMSPVLDDGDINVTNAISSEQEEERSLVIENTAQFEDWVIAFFNRCIALFESLPEEGGRNKKTGGKQEEAMLSGIREAVDVVCFQLSDEIFDIVLNRVFQYATSNTKLNTMRAFTHLVRRLTRTNPEKALAKFLPHCTKQVIVELEHGAASVATTSTHEAVHSDTALLWNLSILNAAVTHSGTALLDYRKDLLNFIPILMEKIKNERAYTMSGSFLRVIFEGLTSTYTLHRQSLNTDHWKASANDRRLYREWGKFYDAKEVKIDWHCTTEEEIAFVLELLEKITGSSLSVLEKLLDILPANRDKIWRNDWCRHLNIATSSWKGLDQLIVLDEKSVLSEGFKNQFEIPEMHESPFKPVCNMILSDPTDRRYKAAFDHRKRFGRLLHRASVSLQEAAGEDLVDAIAALLVAIDTFMEHYGSKIDATRRKRASLDASRKDWVFWRRQYDLPRLMWLKFAEGDHSYRLQYFAQTRSFSDLERDLLLDMVEFCKSPYLRVRRNAQGLALVFVMGSIASSGLMVKTMLDGLVKDTDSDCIKGALYTLRLGDLPAVAVSRFPDRFFVTLLWGQKYEKNSIQQLIGTLYDQGINAIGQEVPIELPDNPALAQIVQGVEFLYPGVDQNLETQALSLMPRRAQYKRELIAQSFLNILSVAQRENTHWRYREMALRALAHLRNREVVPPVEYVRFLVDCTTHTHASIRSHGRSGLDAWFNYVQRRTFAKTREVLWFGGARTPLSRDIPIKDTEEFIQLQMSPIMSSDKCIYFDYHRTFSLGWILWNTVRGNIPQSNDCSTFDWEASSVPHIGAICSMLQVEGYFENLIRYYAEEPNQETSAMDVRDTYIRHIQLICEIYGPLFMERLCNIIEPLWKDDDKFKQRAAAEIMIGLIIGSRFWSPDATTTLWNWMMVRWPQIFQRMKPDTMFWDAVIIWAFTDRDPRRSQPLLDWVMELEIDFQTDSAFSLRKELTIITSFYQTVVPRYYGPQYLKYIDLMFKNVQVSFEQAQQQISTILLILLHFDWLPSFTSTQAFIEACATTDDVFNIRQGKHLQYIDRLVEELPRWRQQRLPLPKAHQSTYDTASATLIQLFLLAGATPSFYIYFPYLMPLLKEFIAASEITDNPTLSQYSVMITRVLLAVASPSTYIQPFFNSLVDTYKDSASWRVRQRTLILISGIYLRYIERWSEGDANRMLEVMLTSLEDENIEVRTSTSNNLALIVRCSLRGQIGKLQKMFIRKGRRAVLPARSDLNYDKVLRTRHAAVLGLIALIRAYPFTVPEWMPPLIDHLSKYATDPSPISNTLRTFGSEFQKTHQDNWHADAKLFNEDQTLALSTIVSGTSYYA